MINFFIGLFVGMGLALIVTMLVWMEETSGHGDDIDRGIYGE